jgi:PAS domain S-box-containing protein
MVFFRRILKQKELVLILLTGLIFIFITDAWLVQSFSKDQEYREHVTAERLKAQIQSALEEHVTALIALKVVYQNFTDINHYDFQQYGKSITSSLHGFQRLFYIDPNYTIRQVYPMTPENTGLYGYSLKNQSPIADALTAAKTAASPTTSRLIPFLDRPKSFWAFIPIYRGKSLLGFAAGELSLERIWQPFAVSFSDYQMQLQDPTGVQLFQQVNLSSNVPNLLKLSFNVAGNDRWTLILRPLHQISQTLLLLRVSLWLGGLLILFLISKIISSTKKHKTQLEEAQKQFETIVEASPDGIVMLDDKLRLKIANPVVRQWLGKTAEELANKTFFEIFECQCPNLKKCGELTHLLCTSNAFSPDLPDILETRIIDPPDGSPKTLRLNASKITHEHDGRREEGFICVLGDISTSKELDRVKETYVATLTHDLKTPLLAQQMVLETLSSGSMGAINEEQKRLLLGAKESVQDLVDMVNSTLLFYKLESSHVTLHRQRLQLPPLVRDVMNSLQPLAQKRDVSLEVEAALDLPAVWIDSVQLKRVFHNLISNAISYSRKSSPIRVSIHQDSSNSSVENRLLIEVYNEGKGITEEELPKIFDKYYSISRKFKQIGTGLGLYISRRIVELHGGKIWAASVPNQTTRFFISLPYVQPLETGATPSEKPISVS